MTLSRRLRLTLLAGFFLTGGALGQGGHPNLVLTAADIAAIREGLGRYPLFDRSFAEARAVVDSALVRPMDVPVPKDAGGYTHERHKRNYTEMQLAGVLYAVTKDGRYARFIRDMLMKYAALYPTLGTHPKAASEAAGRLFWQTLNETVWLVYTTQAYDCVYDWLSPAERRTIESKVLRPLARFFVKEHAAEFDRIHNHGTWMATAVGLTGYVLGDTDLVAKALYGTKKDHTTGFLRQMDLLFSPDGYYTEGAYYARYAIMPFFLFARAIENNQPGLHIFEYRGQLLRKALSAALQLTNTNGAFVPINDALKEKTYLSPEIVIALDETYAIYGHDPGLLGIAKQHGTVMLSGAGLAVARGLARVPDPPPFAYASMEMRDGGDGLQGGVGLLRWGPVENQSFFLMKYTAHGMSHGHYDKLSILYDDAGREILQDYGAARFINVEPKDGGRYLPETKKYCMQTIAHNTVTVDERSHYDGKIEVSEQYHADRHFFSASDSSLQVVSAKVDNAYPDVRMQRTSAMVADPHFIRPVIIDVFRVISGSEHQYDLPFYFMGHLIETNVSYSAHDRSRAPLGAANGYQYLWNEAEGPAKGMTQFSWLAGERFYSVSTAADSSTQVYFVRIGASDPNFDLRPEAGVILRTRAKEHVFASVIEPHGVWDGNEEFCRGARSSITDIRVLASTDEGTVVGITDLDGLSWQFMVTNGPADDGAAHAITVDGTTYRWTGNFHLIRQAESGRE